MISKHDIPRVSGSAISHTFRFLRDPFTLFEDAYRQNGPVFSMKLLGIGEWVFLCSPEAIKAYYRAPTDVLVSGEIKASTVGFMLGLDSTFTLDGAAHTARKYLVLPQLNGPKVLRHVDTMRQATEETIASWTPGKRFVLLPECLRLSLEVMVRILFGTDDRAQNHRLREAFERFSNQCMRSPLINMPFLQIDLGRFSPWGRVLRLRQETRQTFRREIDGLRLAGSAEGADLLSVLMNSTAGSPQLGDEAVLDELLTLLFAGHETTGGLMTWIIEAILSHPEVLAELDAELEAVLGGEPINSSHLRHLKYLEAVIQEGIRVARSTAFNSFRLVKKTFQVEGFDIPPDRVIAPLFYTMGQREDLFPAPHVFSPRRFLDGKHNWAWSPFGHGTRICTGKGVAQVELKVVLATLFQKARLQLTQKAGKIDRHGLFFVPQKGLRVVFEERD